MSNSSNTSSQPYKGTRDFYPDNLLKRNYIFQTWSQTLINNGYHQYDCSVIENSQLYIAKSGEELGSKQLYSFVDKGDRAIALRPEMTPSIARMVANKFSDLKFPLRWFSIPNCFRYERPQKGRLREFWQLNVDIIGNSAGESDLEVLNLVGQLFLNFGADKSMFKIMFNHRQVLDLWLTQHNLESSKVLIYAVIDDWFKSSVEDNQTKLAVELNYDQILNITNLCAKEDQAWQDYLTIAHSFPEIKLILELLPIIAPNVEYEFSPSIIRGIAYYTGLVFEGFNKNPKSPRAMFGGGRYDNLMELFNKSSPAIGFGVGDVTWDDFLVEWNLYPDFESINNKVGIMPKSQEDLVTIFATLIPYLKANNEPFDVDYDYARSENKRYKTLKKRGCSRIISQF